MTTATQFRTSVVNLRLDSIMPDSDQPRKHFDEEKLRELATSMGEHGLLQPIVVRPLESQGDGSRYILIAGERRWRAGGILGWVHIPAIVRKGLTDGEAARLQLLENIVREALNPVEEARAYKRFLDDGYTLQEVSKTVGLAATQVSWRVSMLNAREDVLHMVERGQMQPSIALEVSRLSPNGQGRALRIMNGDHLTYVEVIALCQRILAEESQTTLFEAPVLTQEQRRVGRNFVEVTEQIGKELCRLREMERKQPGAIGKALEAESVLAEATLDELAKGLYKVKKALQVYRINQSVDEASA